MLPRRFFCNRRPRNSRDTTNRCRCRPPIPYAVHFGTTPAPLREVDLSFSRTLRIRQNVRRAAEAEEDRCSMPVRRDRRGVFGQTDPIIRDFFLHLFEYFRPVRAEPPENRAPHRKRNPCKLPTETMIVIADSGSTKCNWQLVDDSGSVRRVQSRGINAVLQRPDEVEALLHETFAEPVQADALHFYGAGCGERYPEQSARLREALARYFPAARIAVESDLMGAARALLGGRAGIACILGTGSNSCYYDGVRIVRNTPPLGWVLGDEGSGTYIGRQLVGNLLKGLCDESLRRLFFEEERLDYDEIIRRVYREGMANRFLASFTRFVARHIDRPELDELVCEAFRAFVRRNLAHYPADAEVSALGGVACHFERQLRHVLATEGLRAGRIVETPDEGLLNYHIWNRSE